MYNHTYYWNAFYGIFFIRRNVMYDTPRVLFICTSLVNTVVPTQIHYCRIVSTAHFCVGR